MLYVFLVRWGDDVIGVYRTLKSAKAAAARHLDGEIYGGLGVFAWTNHLDPLNPWYVCEPRLGHRYIIQRAQLQD